jgi:hypothetical protein
MRRVKRKWATHQIQISPTPCPNVAAKSETTRRCAREPTARRGGRSSVLLRGVKSAVVCTTYPQSVTVSHSLRGGQRDAEGQKPAGVPCPRCAICAGSDGGKATCAQHKLRENSHLPQLGWEEEAEIAFLGGRSGDRRTQNAVTRPEGRSRRDLKGGDPPAKRGPARSQAEFENPETCGCAAGDQVSQVTAIGYRTQCLPSSFFFL